MVRGMCSVSSGLARSLASSPSKPKKAARMIAVNRLPSAQPVPVAGFGGTMPEPSRSAPAPKLPSKEQYWPSRPLSCMPAI